MATGTQKALEPVQESGAIRPPDTAVQLTRTVALPRPTSPARSLNPWFLSPAVFISAALVTFLLLFLRTGSVTASTPQTNPLFDPRSANLQMRIETDGPGLLLSWNRYSRAVQAASSASLAIQDGPQHRDIALDRNQIMTGSVFYRPASDDVSFRLELNDGRGSNVSQILRVLDFAPAKPAVQPAQKSADAQPKRTQTEERVRESTVKAPAVRRETPSPVQLASAAPKPPAAAAPKTIIQPPTVDPAPTPSQSALPQLQQSPAPIAPTTPSSVITRSTAAPTPAAPKDPPAYVPPRPLKWVQANVQMPQPLDVKVKVRIDETGHVIAAHALMDGATRDKKLLAAAAATVRQWTFEPAQAHGTKVPCEEVIVVHLGPEAQ